MPPTTKSKSHKRSNFEHRESCDVTRKRQGRESFPKRGQKHDRQDEQARKEYMGKKNERILKPNKFKWKTNSNTQTCRSGSYIA